MNQFSNTQCYGSDIERLSSSSGEEREANAMGSASASRDDASACADIVHELSTVLGGMLVNAQVMQWKLPAYSHSKRYVREIERGAQRGASLVKQLLQHLGAPVQDEDELCGQAPSLAGTFLAVTAQEPNGERDTLANQPRSPSAHAAPDFFPARLRRSHRAL